MDRLEYDVILRTAAELRDRARGMLPQISKYVEVTEATRIFARETLIHMMPETVHACPICGHSVFSHGLQEDGTYDGYGCARCILDRSIGHDRPVCEWKMPPPDSL